MIREKAFYNNLEKLKIISKFSVTEEEKQEFDKLEKDNLPEDVFLGTDEFYEPKYYRYSQLTEQEIELKLLARNAVNLQTIKKCAIYFTTISIIGISLYLFLFLFGLIVS